MVLDSNPMDEIPFLPAYNVHGISFRAFLVENIIGQDAFFCAGGANPLRGWGMGYLFKDFVSHHLK